ncbi:MAG: GntR family transcriptional regulator [Lentisphaerae bacterium]|nr:GntR family transcriptional regulator [Lentisphaerota bacterium]
MDFCNRESIPSERELAQRYNCTRTTIRAALSLLEAQSKLSRCKRKRKVICRLENFFRKIVMFVEKESLKDPNFMDFVAGCMHQASEENFVITVQIVDELLSVECFFYEMFSADKVAYLIACDVNDDILKMLDNSGKPCVIMGCRIFKNNYTPKHCFEYYIAQNERNAMVLDKLLAMGHRKILTVNCEAYENVARQLYSKYNASFDDFSSINIHWSIASATKLLYAQSAEIARQARNYTALWIPFGNVVSFGIYAALVREGIKIPEELSVVTSSGRNEWFVSHFKISTVFSSAWDEGVGCVKEISRQLCNGEVVSGIHFTEYYFIDYGTLLPPNEKY